MFHEVVDGADGADPADGTGDTVEAAALVASFETLVREAVEEAGGDQIVDRTGLETATVEAAAGGDAADLTLEEGASVLAAAADRDAETVVAEVRDHLLMGMATAVLDVDTISTAIDADLTGQEVQQVLEGRAAMTLEQLAEVMAVIETRKP